MHSTHQMSTGTSPMQLSFGFSFEDLYHGPALSSAGRDFLGHLNAAAPALAARLTDARSNPAALSRKQQSELVVEVAPYVEDFIGELFGITREIAALQARHGALAPIYSLKRRFVQKKALSGATAEQAETLNGAALQAELEAMINEPLTEASYVEHVSRWLEAEPEHASQLRTAAQYAVWAAPIAYRPRETSSWRAVQGAAQIGHAASGSGGDDSHPWHRRIYSRRASLASP